MLSGASYSRPLPEQILAQDDALNGPRLNPVPVPPGLRQNEFDVHYDYDAINSVLQIYPQKNCCPVAHSEQNTHGNMRKVYV